MADALISTAGTLTFDPATEYQELEELEFEELVQRPESIRFFTLEEQTTDYFNKLLPTSGRVPKSVLRDAEHEIDMMTDLYQKVILETETGYDVRPSPKPSQLSWVSAFSKQPLTYAPYDFTTNWIPLFDPSRRGIAYQVFLDALPKQNYFENSANPILPEKRQRIIWKQNEQFKEVYALGPVLYNKTAHREDGTYRIQVLERGQTEDKAKADGYYILPPPLEPPNPLSEHPFLDRRADPITIDSAEPIQNLLPSLESVLEHAVPNTEDPREAIPYLQVWNLRLSQIPYSIWTEKFKPVETVSDVPLPIELNPQKPASSDAAPPQTLQDVYGPTWTPGIATRQWLSRQMDGGVYAVKLLQALVGRQPLVEVKPPALPEGSLPKSTPDDCLPPDIQDFGDFAQRGIYRNGSCYPLAYIEEERSNLLYKDKLPFTPNLPETIPTEYRNLLQERIYIEPTPQTTYEKAAVPEPLNETRSQILALLSDESQLPSDIAKNILDLFRDLAPPPTLEKHQYRDATTKTFLICEHTLRQLEGDYARDPAAFKTTWTDQTEGSINCQYCGEQISNQVFVVQDQFDEEGRALVNYGALPSKIFQADHVTKTFVASLKDLKDLFDLSEPGQDVMYLLISLLQVLPDADKLKLFVDYVHNETLKVKAKVKTLTAQAELLLSIFGFNAMVVLLLTHQPTLLPRRMFGPRPIQIRGYPRDTEDLNDAPLVDSLMFLLKTTFESYPTTFKGSSVVFLRTLLKDSKPLKQRVLNSLKVQFLPKFKDALETAKEAIPPVEARTTNTFEAPLLRYPDSDFLKPTDRLGKENLNVVICPDPIPLWFDPAGLYPTFEETRITTTILAAVTSERVVPSVVQLQGVVPTKEDVTSRARLALPKDFGSPTYKKIVESNDAITLQRFLEVVLTILGTQIKETPLRAKVREYRIRSQTTVGDPSLLRDAFKGLLIELGRSLDTPTVTQLERELLRNVSVRSMLASVESAKSFFQKLRAQETEQFKQQLRGMTDAEREVTQKLLQLRVVPYLITKKDREEYMRELAKELETLEPPVDPATLAPGTPEDADDIPEEGLNRDRDVGPQGDTVEVDGHELQTDYGDYGDRRTRAADGEEFAELPAFEYDEGYGSAV